MKIAVLGATGNVGREVVRLAASAGHDVRAVARTEPAELPDGAHFHAGDLNDASSLAPALDGADAFFTLAGYEGLAGTLALAREQGTARVVLLSSSAAPSGRMDNAMARYAIQSERSIKASGLAWTMLQPNAFMSNALRWLPQLRSGNVVREGFGDVPLAVIHPGDVAAVAFSALTQERHAGHSYRLSGPESLSTAERVHQLGAAIGRRLTFEALDDEAARATLLETMPEPYVDAQFQFYREGVIDESTVLPTFAEIMGAQPRDFGTWLATNTAKFTRPA